MSDRFFRDREELGATIDRRDLYGSDHSHVGKTMSVISAGQTMFGPNSPTKVKYPVGMRDAGLIFVISDLLRQGLPDNRIVEEVRTKLRPVTRKTVARVRVVLEMEQGSPFLCRCGLPAQHRSACQVKGSRRGVPWSLGPELVKAIRASYVPHDKKNGCGQRALAQRFGVSHQVVRDILRNRLWRPAGVREIKLRAGELIRAFDRRKGQFRRMLDLHSMVENPDDQLMPKLALAVETMDRLMSLLQEIACHRTTRDIVATASRTSRARTGTQ